MNRFRFSPSTSFRRKLRKHPRTQEPPPQQEQQREEQEQSSPEVKSAGGAFCSGLSRSDGSILRSVLGQPTRRPSLTKTEWKYSGQEDHHAHAPKCARRRRSSFGSTCSNDMETLKTLDSAMSAIEAQEFEDKLEKEEKDNHHHHHHHEQQHARQGCCSELSSSEPHGGGGGILMRTMGSRRIDNSNQYNNIFNEDEEYKFQLARSKRLPGTWYFSSNHVLVNKARTKRDIAALIRDSKIDDLARDIAHTLMKNTLKQLTLSDEENNSHSNNNPSRSGIIRKTKKKKNRRPPQDTATTSDLFRTGFEILDTCNPQELIIRLMNGPFRRIGYNFAMGKSIRGIHKHMMMNDISCKNNIVDRRFEYFGMGTATHRSKNGDTELYMVQLYVS